MPRSLNHLVSTSAMPLLSFGQGKASASANDLDRDVSTPPVKSGTRYRTDSGIWRNTLSWPVLVTVGQVIILAFAWGFTGALVHHDQISLPDNLAEAINTSTRTSTLVVTVIATVLSLFSAFLFMRAVRYALTRHLASRSISLAALARGINLSKGTATWDIGHPAWMIATFIVTVALALLTAGWVTLLTPTRIVITRPMNGTELDLGSNAFAALVDSTWTFTDNSGPGSDTSNSGTVIGPFVDVSGLSMAQSYIADGDSSRSTFTFNGVSYSAHTAGILPTGSSQFDGRNTSSNATGWNFAGGIMPPRYEILGTTQTPTGISTNYSLYQQGFTANVSCHQMDSSNTSVAPYLSGTYVEIPYPDFDPILHFNETIQKWMWQTFCPNGNYMYTPQFVTLENQQNSGLLPGLACLFQNMSSTNVTGADPYTHLIVLQGSGPAYDFINWTVCSIQPKLTTVKADYNFLSSLTTSIVEEQPHFDNASLHSGSPGAFATSAIAARLSTAQNLYRNSFGDGVSSVYSSFLEPGMSTENQTALLNEALELYITGIFEFMGTFLRAGFSVQGLWPDNQLPANMSKPFNGTLYIETMGWKSPSAISIFYLVPITFIAVASIALVLLSVTSTSRLTAPAPEFRYAGRPFDPTAPFHLVTSSVRGGSVVVLDNGTGTGGQFGENGNETVRLCYLEDGRVALVPQI